MLAATQWSPTESAIVVAGFLVCVGLWSVSSSLSRVADKLSDINEQIRNWRMGKKHY